MLMHDKNSLDVPETLPLYVLERAKLLDCISVAPYRVSILIIDDSISDAMETLQPFFSKRLSH